MCEEYYVLLEKNDEEKKIFVKKETFALGSEAAIKAKQQEKGFFDFARLQGYKIVCNELLIFDPEAEKKKQEYNKLKDELINAKWEENEQKHQERQEKIREIKQKIHEKGILELTEDEIVLLAQSRVHGDHFTINGTPALGTPTTFEEQYEKIKKSIEYEKKFKEDTEQRKSGNRFHH